MSGNSSSMFVCSISGTVPVDPVVVSKTGLVYSQSLLEKALALNGGVCPRTGQTINKEDIIQIKSTVLPGSPAAVPGSSELVKPRPPSATSIPGLLGLLHSEWEATMLEVFQLRQQLEIIKQDLAQALYKEDAANRVISRLLKERDEARAKLLETERNLSASLHNRERGTTGAQQNNAMEIDEEKQRGNAASAAPSSASADASSQGLPESVLSVLSSTASTLSKGRKQWLKDAQAVAAKPEEVQKFQVGDRSYPLHQASNPGILCVDLHPSNQDLILTGGNDGQAILFNRSTSKIVSNIKAHQSALTDVKFHPTSELLFTSSLDHSVNIFSPEGSTGRYSIKHHLQAGTQAVTGISIHPSGNYLAAGGKDGSWSMYDVSTGASLKKMSGSSPLSALSYHPDGLILATAGAQEKALKIFDLKGWKLAASLPDEHASGLTSFSFSNNGFHCTTSDTSGVVKVWDLRKLSALHTLQLAAEEGDKTGAAIAGVRFDESGSYLSVAVGNRISVYQSKSWEELLCLRGHKERVTGTVWTSQARGIISVGLDRNLKIWA